MYSKMYGFSKSVRLARGDEAYTTPAAAPRQCMKELDKNATSSRVTKLFVVCVSLLMHFAARGRPRWDDRFSQYGIKVSFWGSGTLKLVI